MKTNTNKLTLAKDFTYLSPGGKTFMKKGNVLFQYKGKYNVWFGRKYPEGEFPDHEGFYFPMGHGIGTVIPERFLEYSQTTQTTEISKTERKIK